MKITTKKDYQDFLTNLQQMSAGSEFIEFQKKIVKTQKQIIGVRTPLLRKMAKEIFKCDHSGLFKFGLNDSFEEVLVKGMVLAQYKDCSVALPLLNDLILDMDSWAEVDMVCSSLNFVKSDMQKAFDYFSLLAASDKEFVCRFGVVGFMKYFLSDDCIEKTFASLDKIVCHDYYVEMAVAWLISEVLVKKPQKALENMQKIKNNHNFSKFAINKGIQKATESFRIDKPLKDELRKLKI